MEYNGICVHAAHIHLSIADTLGSYSLKCPDEGGHPHSEIIINYFFVHFSSTYVAGIMHSELTKRCPHFWGTDL